VSEFPGITQVDRSWWQRQAAARLGEILDAHPDLPAIAWTVAPTGSVLTGQVSGLAPAAQVRSVFGAWRLALALADYRERPMSGATTRLHAAARRGEVMVRLTATIFEEDGQRA
jgi:hypothetical protein